MKWIAVILVLLNVVAYLLGLKAADGEVVQTVYSSEYEQINVAAMSVIDPDEQRAKEKNEADLDASTLEEESLAQLKVNQKGQVLVAKNKPEDGDEPKHEKSLPKSSEPAAKQKNDPAPEVKVAVPNIEKPAKTMRNEPPVKAPVPAPAPESAPAPAKVALACYRLGPFKNPKRLTSLRKRLESQGIHYKVDESKATRRVKAVRVYIGPFSDDGALSQQKQQLTKMGIDHFVIQIKEAPSLQLGYFAEPERAKKYQKGLSDKGLPVKADIIYMEGTTNKALELMQISEAAIKALDISKGVNVQSRPCP